MQLRTLKQQLARLEQRAMMLERKQQNGTESPSILDILDEIETFSADAETVTRENNAHN